MTTSKKPESQAKKQKPMAPLKLRKPAKKKETPKPFQNIIDEAMAVSDARTAIISKKTAKFPDRNSVQVDYSQNFENGQNSVFVYIVEHLESNEQKSTLVGVIENVIGNYTAYWGPDRCGNLLIRPVKTEDEMQKKIHEWRWYILDWARHGFLDHENRDKFYRCLEPESRGQTP